MHLSLSPLHLTTTTLLPLLLLIPPTTSWTPLKSPFSLPLATFPSAHCNLASTSSNFEFEKLLSLSPLASLRSGICLRQGSEFPIGSFMFGRPLILNKGLEEKFAAEAKLEVQEKWYPECQIDVFGDGECGGEAGGEEVGENKKKKKNDDDDNEKKEEEEETLPNFPIYTLPDATATLPQHKSTRLRKCHSLLSPSSSSSSTPKNQTGKSILLTCQHVTDHVLPRCAEKLVQDDLAQKALYRTCYKFGRNAKEGSADREEWCAPYCGEMGGLGLPRHYEPGYGPQCKDSGGNCGNLKN